MFPGWVRRLFSSPRQLSIQLGRGTARRHHSWSGAARNGSLLSIGGLDLSFGTNGVVTTSTGDNIRLWVRSFRAARSLSRARILCRMANSLSSIVLARYNANGTVDTTFGDNGVVLTNLGLGDNLRTGAIGLPVRWKDRHHRHRFRRYPSAFVARFNAADGSSTRPSMRRIPPAFIDFNIGFAADSISRADAPGCPVHQPGQQQYSCRREHHGILFWQLACPALRNSRWPV